MLCESANILPSVTPSAVDIWHSPPESAPFSYRLDYELGVLRRSTDADGNSIVETIPWLSLYEMLRSGSPLAKAWAAWKPAESAPPELPVGASWGKM